MSWAVFTQSTDCSFVYYRGEFDSREVAEEHANYYKDLGYYDAWVEEGQDEHLCGPVHPDGCSES